MSVSTPATPTFPQAIEIAAAWLGHWQNGEVSDEVLADRVGELVASLDGARGFFVVALTSDAPLMDRLPECLVLSLRQAGEGVVDLSARNLAMSTAMTLVHRRAGDDAQREGSERVARRCTELLRLLEPTAVKQRLERLLAGAEGSGEDVAFLDRWGYDEAQRQAIRAAVLAVADD